jgi:hypothetical protein
VRRITDVDMKRMKELRFARGGSKHKARRQGG